MKLTIIINILPPLIDNQLHIIGNSQPHTIIGNSQPHTIIDNNHHLHMLIDKNHPHITIIEINIKCQHTNPNNQKSPHPIISHITNQNILFQEEVSHQDKPVKTQSSLHIQAQIIFLVHINMGYKARISIRNQNQKECKRKNLDLKIMEGMLMIALLMSTILKQINLRSAKTITSNSLPLLLITFKMKMPRFKKL